MCGICGFYDYENHAPGDQHVLSNMLHVLHHRGPDDSGVHFDKDLALGMRRLSIIDLDGGKQPITNEDGSVVTVFNGEIYNYESLQQELRSRGHILTTASDTEVIVHLYEDFGDDSVHHLRGMFGIAIWDARRRRLFVARDRLGIKPLYYTIADGTLIFASEIKAILQHPAVQTGLNLSALSNFLSLKYVPSPQTMFEGIHSLPPGCVLTCDPSGVSVQRYWDLSFARNDNGHPNEEGYAEELKALLQECVKMHLRSDVPFGAFLSGGLDSSTIVALMTEFLNEPVKTYSVGFEGDGQDISELPYARLVAKKFRSDHHEVLIGPAQVVDLLEKVVWHLDQPLADEATLATYMVAERASREVKMVLTGEGGDELFAGYARYSGERLAPVFQLLPNALKSLAVATSARLPGLRRQKLGLYALSQSDEVTRFLNWFPLFNSDMKEAVLSDTIKKQLNGGTKAVFAEHLARTNATEPLNRMLYVDTKLWLPDLLLARGDKMSMAVSLEARVPLLDHKLVEFAASLPPNLKVKGLTRKYLLKKVSEAWLPPEIIHRKKQGFPLPLSLWLRKDARSFARDVLSNDTVRRRGLFDPACVDKLIREHESGFADHGLLLWGLINIEVWQHIFLDSRQRPASQANTLVAHV